MKISLLTRDVSLETLLTKTELVEERKANNSYETEASARLSCDCAPRRSFNRVITAAVHQLTALGCIYTAQHHVDAFEEMREKGFCAGANEACGQHDPVYSLLVALLKYLCLALRMMHLRELRVSSL